MGKTGGEDISGVTDRLQHLSSEELRIIENGINLNINAGVLINYIYNEEGGIIS